MLKPHIALRSAHTVLHVRLVKELKHLCKTSTTFAAKFHPQTRCSSSAFIVTFSLIRRSACVRAQFNGCSSKTNAHSETGQMAACCQNLTLCALGSCSALSVLVGALFKKFGLFFLTRLGLFFVVPLFAREYSTLRDRVESCCRNTQLQDTYIDGHSYCKARDE